VPAENTTLGVPFDAIHPGQLILKIGTAEVPAENTTLGVPFDVL
jgi:hypothetical protein